MFGAAGAGTASPPLAPSLCRDLDLEALCVRSLRFYYIRCITQKTARVFPSSTGSPSTYDETAVKFLLQHHMNPLM